jgi:hypothetical protein
MCMSHSHSFGRDADEMYWDDDYEAMIVERECEHRVRRSGTPGSTISGGSVIGGGGEEMCGSVQKVAYEIRSVVDYHNEHEGSHCVVMSEDGNAVTDGAKHISEFGEGEVPEWVFRIEDQAKKVVEGRDVGLMMATLSGPEISMTITTSDSEYNVVFSRIDEWVEE